MALNSTSPAAASARRFWLEFWILFAVGLLAYASSALLAHRPVTILASFISNEDLASHRSIVIIAILEALLDTAVIVGLGLAAARTLGFGAPLLEAGLRREPVRPLLRSVLVSALLVGIILGSWSVVSTLPVFNPNRHAYALQSQKYRSAHGVKSFDGSLKQTIAKVTAPKEMLSYANSTIENCLYGRLFLLSGILWILAKLARSAPTSPSRTLLWIAVVLAPVLDSFLYFAWQHVWKHFMYFDLSGPILDPYWLIVFRAFLAWVPDGVLLGWLYVRRGLECSALASFLALVLSEVVIHLRVPYVF